MGVLALVLAIMMVMGSMSALAATITVKDKAGSNHVYEVYQIFTGTLSEETDPATGIKTQTLSDIEYGENYAGDASYESAAEEAEAITDARDFASTIQLNGEDPVATLTTPNFTATGLADGYYLIIDTLAEEDELADGDMFSRYIVQVIGDTTIAPKKSTVEEDKKITADEHDADESTAGTGEDISADGKADDVSIGEKVTYTIDAKIPLSAADYDKFFFIINDTLDVGLTLQPTTITVYHDEIKDANKLIATTDYTLFLKGDATNPTTNNHSFEVAIKGAKDRAGQTIYVVYQAELNENANIGEIPNKNKTTVTYSNNPEHTYDGEDDDEDGKPDQITPDVYGETPEKETRTYTSSIQVKKVDENNQPLQGAEFQIEGISVKTVLVTTDEYTADEGIVAGHYYKLNDGTYTTTAPTTVTTYKALDKGQYEGGYVKVGDNYVVATYDQLKDGVTQIYLKVNPTEDQYADTVHTYTKGSVTTPVETSESVKAKAFVDDQGFVKFTGLGSGTYTITETTIPAGYNGIDPFTVTLSFDKDDADDDTTNNDTVDTNGLVWKAQSDFVKTQTNTTGTIEESDSNDDGTVDTFQITVKNVSGTTLPETGGIGTTIFYVAGSIMVLAAAILLITKRRMGAED